MYDERTQNMIKAIKVLLISGIVFTLPYSVINLSYYAVFRPETEELLVKIFNFWLLPALLLLAPVPVPIGLIGVIALLYISIVVFVNTFGTAARKSYVFYAAGAILYAFGIFSLIRVVVLFFMR